MMNMKIRRVLLLACCAVMLVAMSVGATLAYLTSSDSVTNTFTVGSVVITLDEAPVDVYGNVVPGDRCHENEYKLIPGHTYTKDPTVHVDTNSEKCWVFVAINNGISAIEAGTTIAAQMTANGWVQIGTSNVYYNSTPVDPSVTGADLDVEVFGSFTLSGTANVAGYDDAEITITAYAVQYDTFASAVDAWNATFGATNAN